MPSTKEIRRRIKSIKSTRQITRAMEMVSAAKMRKAQMQALATRNYAALAWELLNNLAAKGDPNIHRLLRQPERTAQIGIILMSSNRGLIGGFNAAIARSGIELAKKYSAAGFITMGKKARDAVRKAGYQIVADFEKKETVGSVLDINSLASLAVNEFLGGKFDKVFLVHMSFVSTLVQKPAAMELLPLRKPQPVQNTEQMRDYLFEPSVDYVLENILPRLTTMQIYQALLETNAAEHSARMVAMKNASDAAGDLISDLTLEFNKIRQGNITREISEIVAGKLALTN
ncbi:MAG: ATP synthase F1 subunit gamma [Candidatus Magasanikbacteria bacterium RIFCSPHIGHO2_01_FULL_47_8]|uniref:ATP synthase gamma chain n=1 Tax=Candidatus Magasanikbacteria bacterium RIFCSPHIGHO2_01_FULL_47_8 TaxID=1798673 RepID=A0A1F6MAH6_9BACT|nr:MAG: ATP synthase F1 subunit gamma [Candidatus Magasanikbacteria bacterium RIFCSPHIGHO2_01_FULL_47_8]